MKDALDYEGRNQYVLQEGVPKVDLAFYLYASPWEPVPSYLSPNLEELGQHLSPNDRLLLTPLGFTYNYLGPNNLKQLPSCRQSRCPRPDHLKRNTYR
jgi:hypothetical protein